MRDETVQERYLDDRELLIADDFATSREAGDATHLPLRHAATVGALAATLAACGGGDSGSSAGGSAGSAGSGAVLKPASDAEAARFLQKASLSSSSSDIAAVKSQGYRPWLDAQMNAAISGSAEQFFRSRNYDIIDSNNWYFQSRIGDNMIWAQLLSGGNEVRKRVALALSEFFVVSLNSVEITWRSQAMGYYWDLLMEHAFGNYRDLLEAITLNPAMGVFLNTLGNKKADPATGRVADENFGREVMQLFSIGLYELNLDGSQKTSGGQPIETYDNDDVTGIAKAFTGYDYDYTGVTEDYAYNASYKIPDVSYIRQPMTADPSKWRRPRTESYHSDEEKRFLGTTIPAGTGATETLRLTLDTLFNHPNVGPFLGKQMIQRLVTSNPSPAYVQRVANVFNDNGNGVRGDLRAMFKAILIDDEALSANGLTDPYFGKLREPMIRFIQWGRTFKVTSPGGAWGVFNLSDSADFLGQSPLRSPSVFNFFRPGYTPPGSQVAASSLVAPEFQMVNETTVAGYVNFMERSIDGEWWLGDLELPYADELAVVQDPNALLDRLDLLMTAGQLSQTSRDTILAAMNDIALSETSTVEEKRRRIFIGVFLTMMSNEYLIQR